MHRVLRPGRHCVLVLGDVTKNGKTRYTAEIVAHEAIAVTKGGFALEMIVDDEIPDVRRSRRKTATTKVEKIVVLRKLDSYTSGERAEYVVNNSTVKMAYAD